MKRNVKAAIAMTLAAAVVCCGIALRQNRLDTFPLTVEKLSDIHPQEIIGTWRDTFGLRGGVLMIPETTVILPAVRSDGTLGGSGHLQFELHYLRKAMQKFTVILDGKNKKFSHAYRMGTYPLDLGVPTQDSVEGIDPALVLTALKRFPVGPLRALYPQMQAEGAGYWLQDIILWKTEMEQDFLVSDLTKDFLLCLPDGTVEQLKSLEPLRDRRVLVISALPSSFIPVMGEEYPPGDKMPDDSQPSMPDGTAALTEVSNALDRFLYLLIDVSDVITHSL